MASHKSGTRKQKSNSKKRQSGPKSLCAKGRRAFLRSMRNSAGERIPTDQRVAKAFSKGRKSCKK